MLFYYFFKRTENFRVFLMRRMFIGDQENKQVSGKPNKYREWSRMIKLESEYHVILHPTVYTQPQFVW